MPADRSLIVIGKITRPHGIRGELCVQYYAESYDYFDKNQVLLKIGKIPPKACVIKTYKEQGNMLILKIEGINSRTDAESYRNYELVITEQSLTDADLQALNEQEETETAPYLHQIIGCTAFVGNTPLGIIDEISFPAGQEIWFIHHEEQEILFPAVSNFIERYELENNAVYLCPPPGLLEIYLEQPDKEKTAKRQPGTQTKNASQKDKVSIPQPPSRS